MPEGTDRDDTLLHHDPTKAEGCGACPSKSGCVSKSGSASKADAAAEREDPGGMAALCDLLSTGTLARECDTTVRTVRFYEEAGLIEPVARSEGGHRMFEPEQLLKLQLIMDLREAGLSLQDIRALFDLKASCGSAEQASRTMAEALEGQITAMQRKIAVLRRLREELASMVAVVRECEGCDAPEWKKRCGECDVMNRGDLPRAMRLLWGKKA